MLKTAAIFAIIGVTVSACFIARMQADVRLLEDQRQLHVLVKKGGTPEGQLVAVVYQPHEEREGEQTIAAFKVVDAKLRAAVFLLPKGSYRLALFDDRNLNLRIDDDEPVTFARRGHRLRFSQVRKKLEIKIKFPRKPGSLKGYPRDLSSVSSALCDQYQVSFGELLDLDDPRFSEAAGNMGLWEPNRFLREYGAGIYQLAPHDPDKTPVLFVSGASGSAQNWRYFFERLDRDKFEAWYFLYPSGMQISELGHSLNRLVRGMQVKFHVPKIHVVAHSMGGLVAREFIVKHIEEKRPSIIDTFVTISTPWNGHAMAKKGVQALSIPVPSWHDMIPGNGFIQEVFNVPLKPKVDHYLMFGFVPGTGGDGSVSLDSMLLMEAQEDAVEIRGYHADHVEILKSDVAFEYIESMLIKAEDKSSPERDAGPEQDDAGGLLP